MRLVERVVVASSVLGVALGQGVVIKAQGARGSPASLGLQVNPDDPNDANFISQTEIVANVVNECGRTLLAGNIDIGENTEIALSANQVTQVTKGSDVAVTVRQVNETGAGPYKCDLDLASNANGFNGQTNLTVQESQPDNAGNIALTVTMPDDLKCIGASTGDVCTVRCRNANEFGGCVPVQQTDTTPNENTPQNIATAQTLQGVTNQVQQNVADFPASAKGISEAGPDGADQGVTVVQEIQAADPATNGLADAGQDQGQGQGQGQGAGAGRGGGGNGGNGNRKGAGNTANAGGNRGKAGNAGNTANAGNAAAAGAATGGNGNGRGRAGADRGNAGNGNQGFF